MRPSTGSGRPDPPLVRWLGQSRRAFDMLCERAVSRYAHGSMLAEKQTIQNWVADSMAEMAGGPAHDAAGRLEDGSKGAAAARVEIAMIKYFGAKVLYDVIDRAIQVHRSLGFSSDLPLESMYRAAQGSPGVWRAGPTKCTVDGGTSGVLKGYEPHEVPRTSASRHAGPRRSAASPTCWRR